MLHAENQFVPGQGLQGQGLHLDLVVVEVHPIRGRVAAGCTSHHFVEPPVGTLQTVVHLKYGYQLESRFWMAQGAH